MKWMENTEYLQFDNLNFKLAVIQHLVYNLEIMQADHGLGDFDEYLRQEKNIGKDYDEIVNNYYLDSLMYFEELKIPFYMAEYITELYIRLDDDIYFNIYPDWTCEDARFDITAISVREAEQFHKLKEISFIFTYDSTCETQIAKDLKIPGIKVNFQKKRTVRKRKISVPVFAAIGILLLAAAISSFLLIYFQVMVPHLNRTDTQSEEKHLPEAGPDEKETVEDVTIQKNLEVDREFVLNAKYTFIKKADKTFLILDKDTGSYYDLDRYLYVHVVFLYDDGKLLDEKGLIVSEDKNEWYLITNDYSNPVKLITEENDNISDMGIVNITNESPDYFSITGGYNMEE